jgi:hypothetical protein
MIDRPNPCSWCQMRSILVALVAASCLLCVGCAEPQPRLQWLPDQVHPVPMASMPREMRIRNWEGRGLGGHYGGSCVHASSINVFRASGRPDLEQVWYDNRSRGYEGPETGNGIIAKCKEQGIPHIYTESGDVKLLEAATATHRMGIIFYYPSHCINFVEFSNIDGREVAVLLDNNFPDDFIVIDRDIFERSWDYYDGFALFPWIEPVTPRTYPRTFPTRT